MAVTHPSRDSIRDWEVPERPQAGLMAPLGIPVGLAALPGLLVALSGAPVVGLVVGAVLVGTFLAWSTSRGRAALRSVGARPATADEEPRAANLIAGKAADLGIAAPGLWVIPEPEVNALVAWGGGAQVALTRGALDDLTLSELEAAITHCLVRHATKESRRATVALALGPIGSSLTRVGPALDVRTAASTRYPPGLAAAIRKCQPRSGPLAGLWLVALGPTHVGQEDRAEALLDL